MEKEVKEKKTTKKSHKKLICGIIIAVVAIAAVAVTLFFILSNRNPLIGRWINDQSVYYEFANDEKGSYGIDGIGAMSDFKYTKTEDKIEIFYTDNEVESQIPMSFKYRLEDDKMILTNYYGEDVVYAKAKK